MTRNARWNTKALSAWRQRPESDGLPRGCTLLESRKNIRAQYFGRHASSVGGDPASDLNLLCTPAASSAAHAQTAAHLQVRRRRQLDDQVVQAVQRYVVPFERLPLLGVSSYFTSSLCVNLVI